jgi:sec-independent protein translocase protein TatA
MPSIGPLELVIILVIVLLIFGPKRLPGLGRQIGSGMREFKDGITGKDKDDDAAIESGDEAAARAFGEQPAKQVPPAAHAPQQPQAPEQPAAVAGEQPAPDAPRSEG